MGGQGLRLRAAWLRLSCQVRTLVLRMCHGTRTSSPTTQKGQEEQDKQLARFTVQSLLPQVCRLADRESTVYVIRLQIGWPCWS